MFEYACSKANLVNFLYDLTHRGKESIFPQWKGWQFLLKRVYPNNHDEGHFIVLLVCDQECIVFIPVEKTIDPLLLGNLNQPKDGKWFSKGLNLEIENFQQICITSERYREDLLSQLQNSDDNVSLLSLGATGLGFALGGFDNQRLNYRLEHLKIDVEQIPAIFAEDGANLSAPLTISLFYQAIFQTLTQKRICGIQEVSLKEVLTESILFYPQYSKNERRDLRYKVKDQLAEVFEQFFKGALTIKETQNGVEVVFIIGISQVARGKLTSNQWSRAMKESITFLSREEMQPFDE